MTANPTAGNSQVNPASIRNGRKCCCKIAVFCKSRPVNPSGFEVQISGNEDSMQLHFPSTEFIFSKVDLDEILFVT